ncbi:MAG: sugar transferase, partial [Actinomycetota bacterium]|nr:sugar transferase [Actinomycetota bacterium]
MIKRHDFATAQQDLQTSAEQSLAEGSYLRISAPVVKSEPRFKRPLDIVVAVIGLVLSSPIWLVVGLTILLHRDGTILYRQQRWGRGGAPFTLYKFRTMVAHSDRHEIRQASENDERITNFGRLLRVTGIDELPQLINILKGEMSFVGPRALAVGETFPPNGQKTPVPYEETPFFFSRLSVRPGLTGPATVYLPRDAHPRDKFEQDLAYIERQTFWLDVKLITLSLWIS